jgi:hypothetical protein
MHGQGKETYEEHKARNIERGRVSKTIQTNLAIGLRKAQVYQRFKNLSVSEELLPQGDGTIRISPFDDYILFTLYEDVKEQSNPIDLSNVGKVYLSFIGENDTIRIPYYTNVKEVDLSQGQVLFRISESDSKKILALDNNNFYVSTLMVSETGDESDESILYTGTFLSFADEAQESMTSKYETLLETTTTEIAALNEKILVLESKVGQTDQTLAAMQTTNNILADSNSEMANIIGQLNTEVSSADAEAAIANAAAAQANAAATDLQTQLTQQTEAVQTLVASQMDSPQFLAGLAALNVNII